MDIAVVGGGVFGSVCALKLADAGCKVTLFEKNGHLLAGASGGANRLHLGYHYPRDDETTRQCKRGYRKFENEFPEAKLAGVRNAYFIASEGSQTDPVSYLAFLDRHELDYELIDFDAVEPAVSNVSLGILTNEQLFDVTVLRRLLESRLADRGVTVRCDTEVSAIERRRGGFDVFVDDDDRRTFSAVVNCSYAEVNRLTGALGFPAQPRQYEYTAAPIIELDLPAPASITIMDGPFVSLMPLGSVGRYLLLHVDHSVVARSTQPLMDLAWKKRETSPFATMDIDAWFQRHLDSSSHFLPFLKTARLVGVSQGPRMVLADCDRTDARPTMITSHEDGYLAVFSGKVDHCMWTAEEVVARLT